MDEPEKQERALHLAVTALKDEATKEASPRHHMERSLSQDIREERQDLKEAAEHSLNVILDLNLDGTVKWVSPSWEDVIGTPTAAVIGKPIADIVIDDKDAFNDAVGKLQKDDSRSHIVRFSAHIGKLSSLSPRTSHQEPEPQEDKAEVEEKDFEDAAPKHTIALEAQGIVVYDRTSGDVSHTMWMIRPAVVREVRIDLPELLVESLGVGAEMLAHYLTGLAEVGANDPANHPPPLPVLCRICERQITPWWFEKHTELCLQEHKAEMEVQIAHEHLSDHRNAIVKVLDAYEARARQPRPTSGDTIPSPTPLPEYKGIPVGPISNPSSGPSSGRASPASPPSRSRERSSGFGHHRAKSFAIRRPVARIVELVLDLCDTAIEINTPALKEMPGMGDGEFRTQSPQSENRITQVLQWQSPTSGTVESDPGLTLLCDDTARFARQKVEAVFRHRRILEYSERIRIEFDVLVHECIDAAMRKAARIAAGDLTDSSSDTESQLDDQTDEADNEEESGIPEQPLLAPAAAPLKGSSEGLSAMASALRTASNPDLSAAEQARRLEQLEHGRRKSSTPASTRSSSPRGAQTPKSHGGIVSVMPQSKRASICLESDTGAESDSSVRSSVFSAGARRAESPGAEVALTRVSSSRESKRRSLILPPTGSSRGQSPARGIPPPSSPLRLAKGRVPSGQESMHSPITSPVLSTSEFSSPGPSALHLHHHHHHRRQSSAASSDVLQRPVSPRLTATNPQPRAVPPSIKDFEIIKPISKGAFGSVYLSKKKSTGDYFAIKVLKKADMVAKNQVTNVKAERAIMMWQGESDFVAKLYWTFSSKDFLYLVMEYLNGGDCASLIKVLGGLPEEWAKKYIGEVVLGVEHLHSRGIVHRDLKPDNLLIDQKGHLKLTDFGLSRMGLIGRQKRALNKSSEPIPDLLKQGPFKRAVSVSSSRSTSFDVHGTNHSPSQTPSLTPAISGELGQPSYFNLYRESSQTRKSSGHRSDSESSDALQAMFRRFSIVDDMPQQAAARSPIEEENSGDNHSPDPYVLQHTFSNASSGGHGSTPPATSSMPPPPMALFDPQDTSRKFVGTPDYLAPETVNGIGQDEISDWWSVGCMIFEFLYGYPPFHADTPEQVFENILARKIDWPADDAVEVSEDAKDLINRLICTDPTKRLGANADDKFLSGGEEIRNHPWFADINWATIREDEASFVPNLEDPEDTEYFDARGATLQSFSAEFEDQGTSSASTPGADYQDRPHDALSKIRTQVNSIKRGLIPLHIPPHVRDGRSRRLSEPVPADDFGSFSFKNLPVLEKANKDVIQKLRAEAMQAQSKSNSGLSSPAISSPTPSLESSPVLPMPLKRTLSTKSGGNRPVSPLLTSTQASSSPSKQSGPSSPLLVSFSAGQERRKTSSSSSTAAQQTSSTLQPGSFFDAPKLATSFKTTSTASSPIKLAKSPGVPVQMAQDRTLALQKQHSAPPSQGPVSARPRSQTISSQEDDVVTELVASHHKRRSQALDLSPSSSDNEDTRQKALLRVQRRRQSSRRLSQIFIADGPFFRPLDVLICEDHPVSRIVMEKLLEKLRCRTITVCTGSEAVRVAMGDVKFDIIMMEIKLPQINGADVARMIRDTKNSNSRTPIVAVTGYLKELQAPHHFDAMIEKPPTLQKLTDVLSRLCQWKPPPPDWTPAQLPALVPSGLRQESLRSEDSPISNSSSFPTIPSSSWRGSSREDSISSSFFGDVDSRSDDIPLVISRQATEDWRDLQIARAMGGLGISEESGMHDLETKSLPPPEFPHQSSAPAALEHPPHPMPRNRRSAEPLAAKRRSVDLRVAHEWADSGDDEDEELGDTKLRAKSPKGRPRGSSKLGVEMMRTNSHGSVVSVEDIAAADVLPNPPPPVIAEAPTEEHLAAKGDQRSLTPPEVFPKLPGDGVQEIDMEATPRAHAERKGSVSSHIDDGPTPRPSASPEQSAGADAPRAEIELAHSPPRTPTIDVISDDNSLKLPEAEQT
ncbi:hypothetical protein NA57DRAFT_38153 [Rhizodiscina lignyota]|uniref:non-specific serine/threonine protein kinase n=1 Tax=Rhizodiscina lignyota TaxID=1504668 RepID=A0A9P4IEK2_9PEZI|nr:hypothetical protein NA57DRAFT_38153 [Rhizodiscina lignyota]